MASSPSSVGVIAFAEYEADLRSRELRRNGFRVRVPDQAFQVLAILLQRPGELVTREEIKKDLWPSDTFVDFDHGLNNAINRLREGLADSAESPRFVETLPRRGYRFIGNVNQGSIASGASQAHVALDQSSSRSIETTRKHTLPYFWIVAGTAALLFASVAAEKLLVRREARPDPIRSLAVLPLENLSGDPAQDYFADGMTDALITDLARIGSLRVISRTSVMPYKNARKPISDIARELRVGVIVEGSVVRSGSRVRINAQLIQASPPEHHLWAKAYESDVTDVVALQGELARAIAGEIQIQLTPREQGRLALNRPVNPQAYDAYLLGRNFLDRAGRDDLERAVSYLQQAIRFDPNFAPAWAGLADAHRFLGGGGFAPEKEAEQKSRMAVERAVELDPDLAEAHAALGSIQTFIDWDWPAATASFQRALALEPGNISGLRGAAQLASVLGHYDDALRLAREAVERDPLNPRSHRLLGRIARYAGQLDESLDALNKAAQLNPGGPLTHNELGCTYLAKSRSEEALAEMEKENGSEYRLSGLAMAHYALGRRNESDSALAELVRLHGGTAAFQVAEAYGYRGEAEPALYWLGRAYTQRDGALVGVRGDPLFDRLHGDPRYTGLLKKMRLPAL